MKTADLYIRVSTDEQADTGYSQRSQDEILRRYCTINNIQVRHVYFEDHSAKTFVRPEFSKLLINLRKHKGAAELLLFTKWDRFSRNAGDAYGMINTLNKLGIEPQAIEQPLDLSVPENKMMLAFYLAAPEVENDRRALNVISGIRRSQKEGRVFGMAPIGYKNKTSEDGKKYIAPDPVNAPIIQWIFSEVATGKYTAESILKKARDLGIVCSKNNFWNALRNPVYYGMIRLKAYKGEEEQYISGIHQPLISEALFHQVQDVLNGRKKVQKTKVTVDERFPLRGFLLCPDCGKLLTASASKGRKGYYNYYHCVSACGVRFAADKVEGSFTSELTRWKPHPAIQQLYKLVLQDVHEQLHASEKVELQNIKSEMTRLNDRLAKNRKLLLDDSIDPDDYRIIKKECEASLVQLEAKLSGLTASETDIQPMMDNALELLGKVDVIYSNASTEVKRDIVGSIFPEKLEFNGEGYRTARINEAVKVIFTLGEAFGKIKMGQFSSISELSHQVTPLVRFSNHFLHDLRKLASLHAIISKAS